MTRRRRRRRKNEMKRLSFEPFLYLFVSFSTPSLPMLARLTT
jgi:hypothetical protein